MLHADVPRALWENERKIGHIVHSRESFLEGQVGFLAEVPLWGNSWRRESRWSGQRPWRDPCSWSMNCEAGNDEHWDWRWRQGLWVYEVGFILWVMRSPGWVPVKRGKWSDVQYRQQCGGWFKTGVGRPVLGPLPFSRAGRGNRVQTKIQDFTRSVDTHARFSSKRFLWISLQKGPFELGRHKGRIVQEELITVKKNFFNRRFWV